MDQLTQLGDDARHQRPATPTSNGPPNACSRFPGHPPRRAPGPGWRLPEHRKIGRLWRKITTTRLADHPDRRRRRGPRRRASGPRQADAGRATTHDHKHHINRPHPAPVPPGVPCATGWPRPGDAPAPPRQPPAQSRDRPGPEGRNDNDHRCSASLAAGNRAAAARGPAPGRAGHPGIGHPGRQRGHGRPASPRAAAAAAGVRGGGTAGPPGATRRARRGHRGQRLRPGRRPPGAAIGSRRVLGPARPADQPARSQRRWFTAGSRS